MNTSTWNQVVKQVLIGSIVAIATGAFAHCDTLDGPVVQDAREALEAGDVVPTLKWVRVDQEAEVQAAFDRVIAVRGEGDAVRELADHYFFETLVRLHRESEGATYTGIQPVETAWDPVVRAADRSIESGDAGHIVRHATLAAERGIRSRHELVVQARAHVDDSVAAGRHYVEAYVDYVHFVKRLIQTAESAADAIPHDH